jgi:hypothetical protein
VCRDLAGFSVEAARPAAAEHALLVRYRMASGDRRGERRLPFYRVAYLAFRVGYATIAPWSLAAPE